MNNPELCAARDLAPAGCPATPWYRQEWNCGRQPAFIIILCMQQMGKIPQLCIAGQTSLCYQWLMCLQKLWSILRRCQHCRRPPVVSW